MVIDENPEHIFTISGMDDDIRNNHLPSDTDLHILVKGNRDNITLENITPLLIHKNTENAITRLLMDEIGCPFGCELPMGPARAGVP